MATVVVLVGEGSVEDVRANGEVALTTAQAAKILAVSDARMRQIAEKRQIESAGTFAKALLYRMSDVERLRQKRAAQQAG